MIVLEGPDGGGKSTLFEKLKPLLPGHEFLHSGGPIRSSTDLVSRMTSSHPMQVRDRHFCISEPIYGRLFGRENLITGSVMQHFLRFRPLVVFCFSPNKEMPPQEGVHDSPDHVAGLVKHRQAILDAYWQLAHSHLPYKSKIYDWSNDREVVQAILDHEANFRTGATR